MSGVIAFDLLNLFHRIASVRARNLRLEIVQEGLPNGQVFRCSENNRLRNVAVGPT